MSPFITSEMVTKTMLMAVSNSLNLSARINRGYTVNMTVAGRKFSLPITFK